MLYYKFSLTLHCQKKTITLKTITFMKATITYMGTEFGYAKKNEYKATELDEKKANADFLLTFIGARYELRAQNGNVLKAGRSIKKESNNIYYVTEKAYDEICIKYNVMTDF